jgi:cell division protein FtsZ
MTLLEVDEAANAISGQVDPEANIIFGAAFDPTLDGVVRVSVVATGMDGASIAAIDTLQPRRRDAPILVQDGVGPAPAQAPVEADYEPAYAKSPVAEPAFARVAEAEPAMASATIAQPDFGFEPAAKPAVVAQVVPRIVDPAVAEKEDEPLFASPHYGDERRQKGGWLSLFGRPRHESPQQRPAPARSGGGAQAALDPLDDAGIEDRDDLEIPSFLRRLAN